MSKSSKIVVFDLDETLGNFVEFGMFCDALEQIKGKKLTNDEFFQILDLFPEFLRPNIIGILKYLIDKKRSGDCKQIMIYTNNQGPKSWAEKISAFCDYKVGTQIFDQIIAAFKVRGKVVEIGRTSHDKSVNDLLNCTHIPSDTQICFLDDQYHPLMKHNNVYYINVKPYTCHLEFKDMAERYYDTMGEGQNKEDFLKAIEDRMKHYDFTVVIKDEGEKKVDEVISKKIILHLEEFFNLNNKRRTRRKRYKKKSTRKNKIY